MSRKGNAYVLACGCRFFEGKASMCEEHTFDRRQARQTLAFLAAVGVVLGFVMTLVLFGGGCAVDTSGTGVTDAATMDGTLSRADSGIGRVDTGAGVLDAIPEAPGVVDADGKRDAGREVLPEVGGAGGTAGSGTTCPKSNSVNGCALGVLDYPSGPIACCVPVDWEGYRQHCPQPFEGCRWKWAIFDGWTGECCG